jgi:hypothetical protein
MGITGTQEELGDWKDGTLLVAVMGDVFHGCFMMKDLIIRLGLILVRGFMMTSLFCHRSER